METAIKQNLWYGRCTFNYQTRIWDSYPWGCYFSNIPTWQMSPSFRFAKIASVISHNWFQSTCRDSNHGLPLARGILSFLNYSCLIFMRQMQIEMVDLFYDGAAHSSSYPPTHWIMASFPFSGDYLIVIVGRNWQLLPTTLASRSPRFVGYEI